MDKKEITGVIQNHFFFGVDFLGAALAAFGAFGAFGALAFLVVAGFLAIFLVLAAPLEATFLVAAFFGLAADLAGDGVVAAGAGVVVAAGAGVVVAGVEAATFEVFCFLGALVFGALVVLVAFGLDFETLLFDADLF